MENSTQMLERIQCLRKEAKEFRAQALELLEQNKRTHIAVCVLEGQIFAIKTRINQLKDETWSVMETLKIDVKRLEALSEHLEKEDTLDYSAVPELLRKIRCLRQVAVSLIQSVEGSLFCIDRNNKEIELRLENMEKNRGEIRRLGNEADEKDRQASELCLGADAVNG